MMLHSILDYALAQGLLAPSFSVPERGGPGRRSVLNLVKPSRYSGAVLRGIRAQNGVGRPPNRTKPAMWEAAQ